MEELLQDIIIWEKENPPEKGRLGFEWYMVSGDVRTLNSLVPRKILKVVFKSNSGTEYRVTDLEALERALNDYRAMTSPLLEEEEKIPEDIFDLVISHEDKKEILKRALESEKPLHVLLHGEVASAKTLFLECLMRLPRREFILGSSLSRPGIYDLLFSMRPEHLLIDELDKIDDQGNLAALLSLMHKGYIAETKYGRRRHTTLNTRVFASANKITRIPHEILSRFILLRFEPYTDNEFIEVVTTLLTEREELEQGLALYIARKVMNELKSHDVRDSIKVARLLTQGKTTNEVDKIVKIFEAQRGR